MPRPIKITFGVCKNRGIIIEAERE